MDEAKRAEAERRWREAAEAWEHRLERTTWDIRREGRSWGRDEALPRLDLMPEKTEMIDGKLYWTEEDRLVVLGLLLENVGVDKAIRLGDPRVWREAIAALDAQGSAPQGEGTDSSLRSE